MASRSDTYERAYACCDQVLFEDGRFPTIDAIRERIHVNSPAVITRAIKDWTLHFVERHRERLERPSIPTALLDSAESLWKLALDQAGRTFQEQQQALSDKERAWQEELGQLREALETLSREAERDKERLEKDLQQRNATLDDLGARLDLALETIAQKDRELADAKLSISHAEGALAEARANHEQHARDWKDRFDSSHTWHLLRIEEEKTLARAQADQLIADKTAALTASRSEIETLHSRLKASQDQLGSVLERQAHLEYELQNLRAELVAAEKSLAVEREKSRKVTSIVRRQRRPA